MRILFVCNQGKNRSRTAAEMLSDKHSTAYAGIFTNLKEETLEWADLVITMDDAQRKEIGSRFPRQYLKKRILSINVPDIYSYGQVELKELLEERLSAIQN